MAENCGVVTGWSLAADMEGSACGSRGYRGDCKEPVRTNLTTPISSSIALNILYVNTAWRPMRHPFSECMLDSLFVARSLGRVPVLTPGFVV